MDEDKKREILARALMTHRLPGKIDWPVVSDNALRLADALMPEYMRPAPFRPFPENPPPDGKIPPSQSFYDEHPFLAGGMLALDIGTMVGPGGAAKALATVGKPLLAMAAAGGRRGGGSGAGLAMDEASRLGRAKDIGFRTDAPVAFGTAPEGEGIASAAIYVNGRIVRGPTHTDAVLNAERELGIPLEKMDHGPILDGFVTTSGRYVHRREAAEIARRAGQGETKGIFGATSGLASEDVAMAKPGQHAASVQTAATERGLPGGKGVWGSVLQGREASPPATPLWYRTEQQTTINARGAAEHEIQAALSQAWDAGHNSVVLQNYVRPGGKIPEEIVVVRDLNQLRSPKAAFDPAKKDSPNIMASIGGVMVTPAAALLARELMRDPAKEQ